MAVDLLSGNARELIVEEWSVILVIGNGITPVPLAEMKKSRTGLKNAI